MEVKILSADDWPIILIADDDAMLARELAETFEDHSIASRVCGTWSALLAVLDGWQPDLIILDQRLGSQDTLLMLPALRQQTAAPVLFFTGNRSEADRVIGLELGADDFLLKPIAARELVARVRAHLRRSRRREAAPAGTWRIVPAERKVCSPDGAVVPLTSAEYDLLAILAASPGQPIDRPTLTREVLRRPLGADDRSLDKLVHQIRRKIGHGDAGEVIVSVRNLGYVFRGFPAA